MPLKNILITGASRGLGRAIALAFASLNSTSPSRLLLTGRDVDALKGTGKLAVMKGGCRSGVEIMVGDVRERGFWEKVEGSNGVEDIDVLVNAAGVSHSSLLMRTNPQVIEDVLDTNLLGTILGCRTISKIMVRQRRAQDNTGCIINVSSLLGVKGGKGSVVYAASKAGVLGLTRSLALELGLSNIRVNAIVPGYVETRMTEAMATEANSNALKAIPQRRFGTPEEIASAAVFLASNSYANNCVLNLDGGLSAT